MREEKEVLWLVKLFNNQIFYKEGGTQKDYEIICNNSHLDKNFRIWFKKLVEKEIVRFNIYRENTKGSPTKIYLLDKKKLVLYLREFDFYVNFRNIIWDFKYGDI